MSHDSASNFIIVKADGAGETSTMPQTQAEKYLGNLIEKHRLANLKQSLNDVSYGRGKATGAHTFEDRPVLHASSGDGETKSVTVFFTMNGSTARIFAMGKHAGSSSYRVSDYGQRGTDFQRNRVVAL